MIGISQRYFWERRGKKNVSMGNLFARTNLLTRLIVLVSVATFPAVAVIGYMQFKLRADGEHRIAEEALRQAELLNADMANVVEGARQLSLAITHFAAVRDGDTACNAKLAELQSDLPSYAALSVVTAEGRVICATDTGTGSLEEATAGAHVRDVISRGDFDIGIYTPAAETRGAILPFSQPFAQNSGQSAVVIVGLSLDWLGRHLGDLKRPANSTIGIGDRNGITLARFPDHDEFVGKPLPPALRPYINATRRGNAVVTGYDGKERMVGFVPATEAPVRLFVSIGMYLPDMLADLDRVTLEGMLLMITGALISMLLALVVGQRFVRRPTEALLAAARHWTSGDLTARAQLTEPPGSEFGKLAAAFNEMAGALDRQQRELHRSAAEIRRAAEDNAHAFKTPIAVIRQSIEPLRRALPQDSQRAQRAVGILEQSLDRLDGLVASARRLDEASADVIARPRVPVDFGGLAGSLIQAQSPILASHNLTISADLPPGLLVLGSEGMIETVVENLIDNAASFAPAGSQILMRLTREGDFAHLTISDQGPGVPAERLVHIFDRYYSERRAEETNEASASYFGIGLWIARRNVETLGGTIVAENRNPYGLSLHVRLPLAPGRG